MLPSAPNLEQEIKRYQSYVKAQLGELEEIKIEIPSQDLQFLQALATQTETPLQTMIANLLHQFVVHNL
jgi:predicted DNA binding CopG/RHH family protein